MKANMKTEQLYTQEQIVHHVENASPTKFMYSFSKAPRFTSINKKGKCDSFYNLPSCKMHRTCGMGFGTKSDFTKKNYRGTEFISIKRDFDKGNQRGLKYSFGLGRDKFTKQVCPGYSNLDKNVPGPAKYNVLKTTGSEMPYYTLHINCGDLGWTNKFMNNPGPGTYQPVVRINSEGKYPVSSISNIKANNFGLSKYDRWKGYKGNGVPGPNAYKADNTLMGSIYNSKFRSGHLITMSSNLPKYGYKNDYPGPGSYLKFSEFGILVPKGFRGRGLSEPQRCKTEGNIESKKVNESVGETKVAEKE